MLMFKRLFIALAAVILCAAVAHAKDYKIITGPYLQNVKPDAITIMWETDKPGPSVVEYGETKELGKKAESAEATTFHEVTLNGLEPGKSYYYRAVTGDDSGKGRFHTTVGPDTPFRVAVWGDNRTNFFQHAEVARGIAKAKPDVAVNVGDVVTDGREYGQWTREYFKPMSEFANNVPTFISIGNHEHNADWYYKYVSQPGNEAWFSFNYGNAHFTIFDSNQDYKPGSEQYKWLEADLASPEAQNAAWRFVFKHHPEYSEGWDDPGYAGEPDMAKYLMPLYEKYGVDIVFAGHTHDYERGALNGVTYIISGGGGAALDTQQQDIDHITVYASEYQFCTIDIDANKLHFESVKPNGDVIDAFDLSK